MERLHHTAKLSENHLLLLSIILTVLKNSFISTDHISYYHIPLNNFLFNLLLLLIFTNRHIIILCNNSISQLTLLIFLLERRKSSIVRMAYLYMNRIHSFALFASNFLRTWKKLECIKCYDLNKYFAEIEIDCI